MISTSSTGKLLCMSSTGKLFALVLALLFAYSMGNNECQNLDNPTCPYNYKNIMPDYTEGTKVHISDSLRTFMENNTGIYLDLIEQNRPPEKFDAATVFEGLGGRALLYLRLFIRTKEDIYINMANQYIQSALQHIDTISGDYIGYLWGKTGVYCVAAILYSINGQDDSANDMIMKVQTMFDLAIDD